MLQTKTQKKQYRINDHFDERFKIWIYNVERFTDENNEGSGNKHQRYRNGHIPQKCMFASFFMEDRVNVDKVGDERCGTARGDTTKESRENAAFYPENYKQKKEQQIVDY